MSADDAAIDSATATRAQRSLRWYPAAWRARYGEEFAALMEAEIAERSFSWRRSVNVIAHGLWARITLGHGVRRSLWWGSCAALAVAIIAGAVTLTHYWAPITITSGYQGGIYSAVLPTTTHEVTDVALNFSTRDLAVIRITSVALVTVSGFPAPAVVGVAFAPHASELGNDRGWPVKYPPGWTVRAEGHVGPTSAINQTIELGRSNVIWLGLRVSTNHRAYAVEGVRVTYERRGVSHTMTISQGPIPYVICAMEPEVVALPGWCTQRAAIAHLVAAAAYVPPRR